MWNEECERQLMKLCRPYSPFPIRHSALPANHDLRANRQDVVHVFDVCGAQPDAAPRFCLADTARIVRAVNADPVSQIDPTLAEWIVRIVCANHLVGAALLAKPRQPLNPLAKPALPLRRSARALLTRIGAGAGAVARSLRRASAEDAARVSPDSAGPLLDHLKQLGKVARLDVQRHQSTENNASAPAGARIERKETRFNISLYNLANVAPRQTSTINLAADGKYADLQTIHPGGMWQESWWVRTEGF